MKDYSTCLHMWSSVHVVFTESTILSPILSDHSRYNEAVETATPGRWLLDIKRNGTFKVRGVKQGFKEDKLTADFFF